MIYRALVFFSVYKSFHFANLVGIMNEHSMAIVSKTTFSHLQMNQIKKSLIQISEEQTHKSHQNSHKKEEKKSNFQRQMKRMSICPFMRTQKMTFLN